MAFVWYSAYKLMCTCEWDNYTLDSAVQLNCERYGTLEATNYKLKYKKNKAVYFFSHTPLVAMLSWPLLDLYYKLRNKANTSSITLKTWSNKISSRLAHVHHTGICWKIKIFGWLESRQWQMQRKQLSTPYVTWPIFRAQWCARRTLFTYM